MTSSEVTYFVFEKEVIFHSNSTLHQLKLLWLTCIWKHTHFVQQGCFGSLFSCNFDDQLVSPFVLCQLNCTYLSLFSNFNFYFFISKSTETCDNALNVSLNWIELNWIELKVYRYHFTHTPTTPLLDTPPWAGATHSEDLTFVFGLPLVAQDKDDFTEEEVEMSIRIINHWANLAKTGLVSWSMFMERFWPLDLISSLRSRYSSASQPRKTPPH